MKKAITTKTTPATPAPVPAKKTVSSTKPKVAKPKVPKVEKPLAPTAKTSSSSGLLTTIAAQIDIGFGNTLYIRGDGPGLSWEKGVVMDCVVDDKWSISLTGVGAPVVFKFLVNDLTWSAGDDYVVRPGSELAVIPTF